MATSDRSLLKQRHKNANTTFEVSSSVDSTVVEEKCLSYTDKNEENDDGPVVFICGKCKLPLGDSTSWDGSEDGQNQIRLKRVTDNVLISKDSHLHETSQRALCLVSDLTCQGCHSVLGMVYTSTPKNLDHKRFTFWFNVADIDSYVLGSADQTLSPGGPKEQPITLDYRGIVEDQITEMKMLVISMAERLEEIEVSLQDGCDKV